VRGWGGGQRCYERELWKGETGSFPEGDQGFFIAGVMRVEGRGKKGNSDGLYPVCA
jgi:hypothetical protein